MREPTWQAEVEWDGEKNEVGVLSAQKFLQNALDAIENVKDVKSITFRKD